MVHTAKAEQPLLFTPLRIGNVTLKNRICISPMCQYSCEDGFVTDWHLVHLGARAIGGAALVMMEATAVEERGRISQFCPGIWKDEHIEPMKRICQFIKTQNCIPAIQLAHSGRKGSTFPPYISRDALPVDQGGWDDIIGPSPIAFGAGNDRVPKEASLEDIAAVRRAFVAATKRAIEAGFQVIELHFAHGYLVHSFLSPYSNKRTDEYGGTFEGRTRLAVELVRDVKSVLPEDFPLFVRISCTDYLPEGEGWDLEQSVELSKILKQLGVHLVDCSSGGNVDKAKNYFAYNNVDQISMAETIQRKADIPTGAVGGIISPQFAESILVDKRAQLIFLARISLDDPNWPIHAAFELNAPGQHTMPLQYGWSIGEVTSGRWRQTALPERNSKQLASRKNDD